MRIDRKKQLTAAVLAVFCTLLWGSATPCIKIGYPLFGIENGTPFDRIFFAGLRFTGAGILTLLAARLFRPAGCRLRRGHILPVFGLGLVSTTGQYIFYYLGLANTTGSRCSILNGTSTFFTVFLAAAFFRSEKLTARRLIGCLAGFAGIVAINFGGQLGGNFRWNGDFFIIMASLMFAFGSVIAKKLTVTEDPIFVSGAQLLCGGAVLLAVGLGFGGHLNRVPASGVALLTYMAFLSAAAFAIWTALMQRSDMASVSVFFFLVPVFGVALSALFLHEKVLSPANLAALVFVCAGICLVNQSPRRAGADGGENH